MKKENKNDVAKEIADELGFEATPPAALTPGEALCGFVLFLEDSYEEWPTIEVRGLCAKFAVTNGLEHPGLGWRDKVKLPDIAVEIVNVENQ